MAVVSINAIREAVITKLKAHFPSMPIYGEEMAQDFLKPSLFVKLFSVEQDQIIGNRYKRNHSFMIHYYSDSEIPHDDMHKMAEQLYSLLEFVSIQEDLFRGTKMKHEIKDGMLHFNVNYNVFLMKETEPVDEMVDLSINGASRGE